MDDKNLKDIDVTEVAEENLKEVNEYHKKTGTSKSDIFNSHIMIALWAIYGQLKSINKKLLEKEKNNDQKKIS